MKQRTAAFRAVACAAWLTIGLSTASAGNWPQWRGPAGNSVSDETGLPTQWSETSNILWKTPLPEWGTSTPAVWGDEIFVTTHNGDKLLLLAIDRKTGAVQWTQEAGEGTANRKTAGGAKRSSKFHQLQNLASPSPVTDGQRVVVHFGNGELASYRFDGTREWHRNLADDFGAYTVWWGHANSPVLVGDLVISVCMQDSMAGERSELAPSYLVAHHKQTGELAWKTMRMTGADAEQSDAYTTPILDMSAGKPRLIVMGGNQLDAYDPATGAQLWQLPGLVGGRTITGPTIGEGMAYATTGMRGRLQAVRLDRSGKLSAEDAVVWQATGSTPDSASPVVAGGFLFMVSDNAVATCFDAAGGQLKWRQRIAGGDFKASPLFADGNVYFLAHDGTCSVVRAAAEFKLVSENKLDGDFLASPAVSDGKIYLRSRTNLYAIGKSSAP